MRKAPALPSDHDAEIYTEIVRDNERQEIIQLRRDRWRSPLLVRTPVVADPKLRAKWFGMPPSKLPVPKRTETILF